MAILRFENGQEASAEQIAILARDHGIVVSQRPVPDDLVDLLTAPLPDEETSRAILARFPAEPAYPSRDLIVLHPTRPDNEELATKFVRWHRHAGDEVRHILDGAGVFGIVVGDVRAELTVGAGDYVVVPARTEHNFRLTEKRRIKAIRHFSDPAGWAAEFTGR
jgi:1,2-dihydroxy-3-keto-5-methylthiopentene dioxygenase